jgi:HSP20 family protein
MTFVKQHPVAFNALVDELFNGLPNSWNNTARVGSNPPAVNIYETADAYHLSLNAPGRNKEDFILQVDNGLLTISYEQKAEAEQKDIKVIRREYSYKSFKRSFSIDDTINADGIQAKYENGVLKLLLPKKENVKVTPKAITIQ